MYPSKKQVSKAGKKLLSSKSTEERNEALELINVWRTNHLHPLSLMKNSVLRMITKHNIQAVLVSQRLKRLTSIEYKLDLNKNMALGGMQDIGGFRVVLKDAKDLNAIKDLIENSRGSASYQIDYFDDYVSSPKISGYRSIHYVYTYRSNKEKYDGLRVELQIRTKLQHNWATAVETAGIFTKTSLKSSKGPDEWLDFFKLVSSLFAIKEKLPVLQCHGDKSMHELMVDCYKYCEKLNVVNILKALRISAQHIEGSPSDQDYYIINIDFKKRFVTIDGYKRSNHNEATERYLELEKTIKDGENAVVFASSSSFKALKKAYPSYFLDTSEFIAAVEKMNSNCKSWNLL